MKRFKGLLVIGCLLFVLAACGKPKEFTCVESFERHLLKEEYDSAYATINEELMLAGNKEYQLELVGELKEGEVEAVISYDGTSSKTIEITSTDSYQDILEVPADTSTISIAISINENTEGMIKGSLLAR